MLERATREWATSPQMAMLEAVKPSFGASDRKSVKQKAAWDVHGVHRPRLAPNNSPLRQ